MARCVQFSSQSLRNPCLTSLQKLETWFLKLAPGLVCNHIENWWVITDRQNMLTRPADCYYMPQFTTLLTLCDPMRTSKTVTCCTTWLLTCCTTWLLTKRAGGDVLVLFLVSGLTNVWVPVHKQRKINYLVGQIVLLCIQKISYAPLVSWEAVWVLNCEVVEFSSLSLPGNEKGVSWTQISRHISQGLCLW